MNTLKTMACAIALGMPLLASTQSPAAPDAVGAAAPPLRYDSAFAGYQPYQDVPVADWRGVNDTVREAAAKATGQSGDGKADRPAGEARAPAGDAERPASQKGQHREQDSRRGVHGGHQ